MLFRSRDVTAEARALAEKAQPPAAPVFTAPRPRLPDPVSLRPAGARKPASARGRDTIRLGREHLDLAAVSQLLDPAQTQSVAHALDRLADLLAADGPLPLADAIRTLEERIDAGGLETLSPHRGHPGHLARPRALEIHAAVNRWRGLRLEERPGLSTLDP